MLYISYDGLTDPLGQSQIIPYLTGLSEAGHKIFILSTEKKLLFKEKKHLIENILLSSGIQWFHILYSSRPKVISTLFDILKLKRKAKGIYKNYNIDAVHCRSYIPSLIGVMLKTKYGIKFLFDMRGFWADERVDGKIWNLKNPFYRFIYKYFKKKEKEFLQFADGIISLTENGRDAIHKWSYFESLLVGIDVIPCCVDTGHFNFNNINYELQNDLRQTLLIKPEDLILSYLGSVGTWYMLDEMLQFFNRLLIKYSNAKFLFVTPESKSYIHDFVKRNKILPDRIIVVKSSREQVPIYLSLSKLSIFFIKPVYSKQASSPTKLAELMSMGIPFICNAGVGDIDEITKKTDAGLIIKDFNIEEYDKVIRNLDSFLNKPKETIRTSALELFSLKSGIEKYRQIYETL
ncbi:glycosyltransferase [candidate division KSB1 bacterium]